MKKIFKSIWMLFLLPIIVAVIGGIITSKMEEINFFKGVCSFIKLIIDKVILIFTIKIPLWIIFIIILILFLIIYFINKFINKDNDNDDKWYEQYKEDTYEGIMYTWDYYSVYNEISIKDFRAICNICQGEVIPKDSYNNRYYGTNQNFCPNCKKILKTPNFEDIETAKVFVHNKLKKMEKEIKNRSTK